MSLLVFPSPLIGTSVDTMSELPIGLLLGRATGLGDGGIVVETAVGLILVLITGLEEGPRLGATAGVAVGPSVRITEGLLLGAAAGLFEGKLLGATEGWMLKASTGHLVGAELGVVTGLDEGIGRTVGFLVSTVSSASVGLAGSRFMGSSIGAPLGMSLEFSVGESVTIMESDGL